MPVKTKVRVVLEISTDSKWGDDCTMGQIRKQSLESVTRILSKALDKSPQLIEMLTSPECISINYDEK